MKNIYIIGGTMGCGKTTTCEILKNKLENSVFLDGDWCWNMHPFNVTENTKQMVLENINYMLNNFIKCPEYKNIIFCWVMHQQPIIDNIVNKLNLSQCDLKLISLICNKQKLKERLQKDIDSGKRINGIIEESINRIPLYNNLNTIKIDVSYISPQEAAQKILNL